jgi:hypothetical protein
MGFWRWKKEPNFKSPVIMIKGFCGGICSKRGFVGLPGSSTWRSS